MRYKLFISFVSLLFISKVEANNIGTSFYQSRIEIDVPAYKGKTILLINYWERKTYTRDSVKISDQGKALFELKEELPAGQYMLYIKPDFQIDLLVDQGQNDIRISINDAQDISKNRISGSKDTELLWNYLFYLQEKRKEKLLLEKQIEDPKISATSLAELKFKLSNLDNNTQEQIELLVDNHKNTWFGVFIKGMEQISLPYSYPRNEEEYVQNNDFAKKHYFDNINLTDPRFWQTNYFSNYIDNYLDRCIDPVPDSLANAASQLVAKTVTNNICFKAMLSKLMNDAIRSKVMGHENVWSKLAEDYIFGKNISWIDSTQIQGLEKMYEPIKNNRIGMRGHNLILEDMNGKTFDTDKITAEYLLLYFYNPDCGHCKKEAPLLHHSFYKKYKKHGVEVLAININSSDKEEWGDFIKNNNLTSWINAGDPRYTSLFWLYYDTSSIPAIFVLDKDRKIVARKIDEQNLEKLFDFLLTTKNGIN